MREVKFRAYQQHDSLNRRPGIYQVQDIVWYDEPSDGYTGEVFFKGYDDSEYLEDVELLQLTGLKDKDGVETYQGDILYFPYEDKHEVIEGEVDVDGTRYHTFVYETKYYAIVEWSDDMSLYDFPGWHLKGYWKETEGEYTEGPDKGKPAKHHPEAGEYDVEDIQGDGDFYKLFEKAEVIGNIVDQPELLGVAE